MILSAERRAALTAKAQVAAGNLDLAQDYLLSRGISIEAAQMFSLGYVPTGQEYGGRLSIPYVTPGGVVGIKYGCTDMSHGNHKGVECHKYMSESGCGVHLFNAQVLISTADTVVVTEGELDAVCVQAYCGIPSVAYPGVDTWAKQAHWRLCFDSIAEAVVVADGDSTGREAARRVAESIGPHARVADLPDGHDSNSFLAAHGAQAFLAKII